ncbi:hypothetical protein KAU11_10720 [Candidatus Babeliales bacterium]|nr:hypothetical protein [Candidatus Babeliales bacterium]
MGIENYLSEILVTMGSILTPFVYKVIQSKRFRSIVIKFIRDMFFNITSRDYKAHHFYANLLYHSVLASNIEFECSRKTELFNILSKLSLEITESKVTLWIEEYNKRLNKMSKVALRGQLMALLDSISDTIKAKAPDLFFNYLEDRSKAREVFKVIYEGKGNSYGYEKYMTSNNKHVVRYVKNIPNYEEQTNFEILSMFMSHLDVIMSSSIHDLKEGFDSHNGSLCNDTK